MNLQYDADTYDEVQQLVEASPESFWMPIARCELHWFHSCMQAWLSCEGNASDWAGWDAATLSSVHLSHPWVPWSAVLDATEAPHVRWFRGGLTNAAFNETDCHVLQGHGNTTAFISSPGAMKSKSMTFDELLVESVLAAHALSKHYGVSPGQRVGLYLPNDLHAVVWIEGAKRSGMPYTAVASVTASHSLASRLLDTSACILISSEGLLEGADAALRLMALSPRELPLPIRVLSPYYTSTTTTMLRVLSQSATEAIDGWQLATVALQLGRARLSNGGEVRSSTLSGVVDSHAQTTRRCRSHSVKPEVLSCACQKPRASSREYRKFKVDSQLNSLGTDLETITGSVL